MSGWEKEGTISYDPTLFHLKRTGAVVSVLPVCQGCGRKLDYDDIGERKVVDRIVPDGEGGYVRELGFVEFCKHCGHVVGDWGDYDFDVTEEDYLRQEAERE